MPKLVTSIKLGQWITALGQTRAAENFGVLLFSAAGDTNLFCQVGVIGNKRRLFYWYRVDTTKERPVKIGIGVVEGDVQAHG